MSLQIFIQIIIGLATALIVYNFIHYIFVTRPTRRMQIAAQNKTDHLIKIVISKMVDDGYLVNANTKDLFSKRIADVWGRGVLAFEYILPKQEVTKDKQAFKLELNQRITRYCQDNDLMRKQRSKPSPLFVVTDLFDLDDEVHFDVAYLNNQTTVEYVDDLHRLAKHND